MTFSVPLKKKKILQAFEIQSMTSSEEHWNHHWNHHKNVDDLRNINVRCLSEIKAVFCLPNALPITVSRNSMEQWQFKPDPAQNEYIWPRHHCSFFILMDNHFQLLELLCSVKVYKNKQHWNRYSELAFACDKKRKQNHNFD